MSEASRPTLHTAPSRQTATMSTVAKRLRQRGLLAISPAAVDRRSRPPHTACRFTWHSRPTFLRLKDAPPSPSEQVMEKNPVRRSRHAPVDLIYPPANPCAMPPNRNLRGTLTGGSGRKYELQANGVASRANGSCDGAVSPIPYRRICGSEPHRVSMHHLSRKRRTLPNIQPALSPDAPPASTPKKDRSGGPGRNSGTDALTVATRAPSNGVSVSTSTCTTAAASGVTPAER